MTTCLIFFLIIPCLNVICSSAEIAKCNGMVEISGGKFRMGTDVADGKDGEGPSRSVHVSAFKIDKCPVTNEDFRKFVREKKFKTESERFGWSFVFHAFVPEDIKSKIKQAVQVSAKPPPHPRAKHVCVWLRANENTPIQTERLQKWLQPDVWEIYFN